jgi:two-component system cell cycle sensor histidine kinase/response regulator CckA
MLLDRINDAGSSEELFRALTSHTPVGVFVSNAFGACVYVNDRWCELAGLEHDEALGDGWQRALHPDDTERVLGEWADAGEEERDSVVEYRFLRPDGQIALIRGFASALRNDEGGIIGWTGTCLDLTASVRREEQQEAVAEFGLRTLNRTDPESLLQDAVETVAAGLGIEYSNLLEVQPDGETMLVRAGHGWNFLVTDIVARLVGDSPAAQALRASGPVLIDHDPEIVPDRRGALLKAHDVASSAAMVIYGQSRPWGVLAVHSRRRNAFTENDLFFLRAVANVFAAALDRQRSEQSARQLAGIVESTLDAIFSRTNDGIVTSWNAAAVRMYGYTADEMIGRSINVLVPSERQGEPVRINERLRRGETVEQFETVRVRKDGTHLDVAVTVAPVRNADGEIVGISAISRDIGERKRMEAALRRSEARARAVLESALDAVVTIDHEGAIIEFNSAAEKIFGHRRDDVLGSTMSDLLVPPAFREQHRQGFARFLASGEARILGKRLEIVALRADGSEFPVELTVNAVNLDGPPVFTAFLRDISDRRQAEQEQRELAAIVNASDAAIIGTTLEGVVTSWNAGAERIYGYAADEVLGREGFFMVPPERAHESVDAAERMIRGETVRHFETVRLRKGGTPFDVSLTVSPITDDEGRTTGFLATAQDITERKQAEAQLRQSEARYRDLFENATDLIATVDLEARFTDVNAAFAQALGYTRGELLGRPLADVVPPEALKDLQQARLGKLEGEVEATIYEHDLIGKKGDRIEVEVSSRVITQDGEPVGIEAICRDVSERKRLEAQLRQAQKMEAVGNLAGGIAHDFNNLLTVINGNVDRALGLDDIGAVRASLGSVLKAGQSAAALTRQLLAFSRQQVLQPRVLDLADVLANVEQLLDRLLGENVCLEHTINPGLGNVRVDPSQIEQVLLNLGVNARDAMPDGGSIKISAENVDVDAAYAATRDELEPGNYVELTFSDTGTGMDEETRGHIFEPFFTTKDEGTGLGLATVYGIVKQSGGNISVYSELGSGTTFRILLPRVDTPSEQHDPPQIISGKLAGTETILVIEDNELVRELTAEILDGLGYRVHTAGTADEVLALASSLTEPLHLIVSDVMVPGQPGPELVAIIQRTRPETKCLFTSGYAPSLAGLRGGFESDQPFLAKPFTTIELASLVRQVLDDKN